MLLTVQIVYVTVSTILTRGPIEEMSRVLPWQPAMFSPSSPDFSKYIPIVNFPDLSLQGQLNFYQMIIFLNSWCGFKIFHKGCLY